MKKIVLITKVFLILFASCVLQADDTPPWTWLYHKRISPQDCEQHKNKRILHFSRENIDPFTQLMFSWNAIRPTTGYFSFHVSVRDAETKAWGTWHPMMEWGDQTQRSLITSSDGHSRYIHVRLEADAGHQSDGFRIKVVAHEGADMALLKAFSVCASNFEKFNEETSKNFGHLPSVRVHKVPRYSQFMLDHPRKDSLCSPTSCSMLTSFLVKSDIDPIDFAEKSYDHGLGVYGSWPFNMAHAFERCAGSTYFCVARFQSFAWLHSWLERGLPVVVSVRGPLRGAARPYAHGHLLVVVGWDQKTNEVICHDPAFDQLELVRKRYALQDFLLAWERSRRLVYLACPAQNQELGIET